MKQKIMDYHNSGYGDTGASFNKPVLREMRSESYGPEKDIIEHLPTLRKRSLELFRGGSAIATAAIERYVKDVVGTGLTLSADIDAEALDITEEEAIDLTNTIEREFEFWASQRITSDGSQTFRTLQDLAFRSSLLTGDVFFTFRYDGEEEDPYKLKVDLIDGSRVCSGRVDLDSKDPYKIYGGIEVDKNGKMIAIYVSDGNQNSVFIDKSCLKRIEVYGRRSKRKRVNNFIFDQEVPGQRRGTPLLARVISELRSLGCYVSDELLGQQLTASVAFVITNEHMRKDDCDGEGFDGQLPSFPLGKSTVIELEQGQDIKQLNPSRQNNTFGEFINIIVKCIGAALGIPPDVLTNTFNASYSASRAALNEYRKTIEIRRDKFISHFIQPIYEEWFDEAVATGRIHAPGYLEDKVKRYQYLQASWTTKETGHIDPVKEARAYQLMLDMGAISHDAVSKKLSNSSFRKNILKIAKEKKFAEKHGVPLVAIQNSAEIDLIEAEAETFNGGQDET